FMFSLTQNYLTRGFWGDEAWTSLISQLPYSDMLKTTAADFHPPGYYTVVELVYKFLPPTEIATRSISIIFYLLTLFMVYKLASFVRGKLFGLLSAAVVALNPIFFTYAFEARNYTMFAFAATGSVYFLIELSKKFTWQRTVGFILFSALGIYTHYYMFFVLAGQGIYILLYDRQILLKMIGAYFAVALLYLPWIPFLAGQLNSVAGDYWIGGIDKRTHYEALLRILGGEHQNTVRPWLFGLSVGLLLIGILQHILRHKFEKPYLLTWLWAVVPFILASLPGLKIGEFSLPFRPIFFWRYLIGSSVPLSMVMIHTAQKFPKYLMWASVGSLIVLSLAVDLTTIQRYPYGFKQVYEEKILDDVKPDDKLITVLPSFAEVLYYRNRFGLKNELVILPEGLVQFSGKSLLDAYAQKGAVRIDDYPNGRYYELRPGPSMEVTSMK
ncbi:MAG TPA: glycosyltransferase family 39 protein, partial [Patescibacteria group bacterium]|nr:glycosyltransferase family 39 protein [Patescibacteria group bacterium]